jgi:preprotein translocase subunit SecD
LFGIVTVVAVVYLVPNFVGSLPSWWSSFLPAETIHLGLDLQGGSHLVLEVKVDKAVEHHVERLRGDLTNNFREKAIPGVSVERVEGTQLLVKVPAVDQERVRGVIKGDFGNLTEAKTPQTGGGSTEFFLILSREELRNLRDTIVDQSLETIRNRIDQFGVSEPIIQRQGYHR